jgi:hypothetical protein
MFSIVLVCLENFQEYILTNIAQLLKLGHTEIYVLTNDHLMQDFEPFSDIVKLISVETLEDPFDFKNKSTQNKDFRNGFWHFSSARLFVLHSFMVKYNVKNVIHIENDVLLYYNCDEILTESLYNQKQAYIPFDSYDRNVASIVYMPDGATFERILEQYNFNKNDMYNFSEIRKKTDLINTFPIFVNHDMFPNDGEKAFVTNGWERFGGYIFDAAAMGQYVGGVDPRNIYGDTRGFVNETCVIKYNDEGEIFWQTVAGLSKPFIKTRESGVEIPIFNLHIHSKALMLYC